MHLSNTASNLRWPSVIPNYGCIGLSPRLRQCAVPLLPCPRLSHVCIPCVLRPSLVQSFVGSRWSARNRAASMSSTASCSTCITSPTWSCWWATPTSTATCCPSTMMITTTKPSQPPAPCSDCSCRGKVSMEEVMEQRVIVY